jgi:predicted aldo/keto reductase-like oxidoreductase
MERRTFLKLSGTVAGGCVFGNVGCSAGGEVKWSEGKVIRHASGMPRRVLGRTGAEVSMVGFPGLAMIHDDQEACNKAIRKALDIGVNYFDVAPAYGNGVAEERMGIAMEGIDKSRIFLACKTKMRDKEGARMELERSLKRLKTDHFDLYQVHHIRTAEEVQQALGPGGAIETFLEAKKEGKVRWLGFSAHTTKGAVEAMNGFAFDTCMFPINCIEYYKMGFGKEVLEVAAKKDIAVVAIKTMSRGAWATEAERSRKWWYHTMESTAEIDMAVRWSLSQGGVVAGLSPSFVDLFEKSAEAAKKYRPIAATEVQRLKELAESCNSLFIREEQQAAINEGHPYPSRPGECPPCCMA